MADRAGRMEFQTAGQADQAASLPAFGRALASIWVGTERTEEEPMAPGLAGRMTVGAGSGMGRPPGPQEGQRRQ